MPYYKVYNVKIGYLKGIDKPTSKGRLYGFNNAYYEAITLHITKNLLNDRYLPTEGSYFEIQSDLVLVIKTSSLIILFI